METKDKTSENCSKRVGDVDGGGVANLHTLFASWVGGYSKLINGLMVAARGAFVC